MEDPQAKYLITMAKKYFETDKFKSKAWLLTATTLFQHNFAVQFEAYEIEKGAKNSKEASMCFKTLFHQFPNNERLWIEIQQLINALRTDLGDEDQHFLKIMFNHLSPDVQHKLLLVAADRSDDTMEHCRLVLLLIKKFPTTITQHGARLIDLLVSAEKHEHNQPVNCYRKLLVYNLLPLLGSMPTLELPPKQLFKLLHKSIEFYLCYLMNRRKEIQDLPVPEGDIEEPWSQLFKVLELVGLKLGWELSNIFTLPLNKELVWQKILQLRRLFTEQPKLGQQLLYCTVVLFLYCLNDYCSSLNPASGNNMVLVEVVTSKSSLTIGEPQPKMRKVVPDNLLNTLWTVGDSSQSSVIANFHLAFQLWQLLYSCDYLEREFGKLVGPLGVEPWLGEFLFDVSLYQGNYEESVKLLTNHEPSCKTSLRLAASHFFLGQYMSMLDNILGAISCWPPHGLSGTFNITASKDGKKRHLHFLTLRRNPVLKYCCKLLIAALKGNMMQVSTECDLAMGHILVLMQLDWPQDENLLMAIIERVQQRNSFTYALFTKYIVLPDIINEFMLLAADSVPLDILPPSSNQMLNHRRISTRGVDKGVKEDFKFAMKRQVSRNSEPIDQLIITFLTEQHDLLGHSLSNFLS